MFKLAKSLAILGRGPQPKLAKVLQIAGIIETTLEHVLAKSAAADEALMKQAETEAALAHQQRLTQDQSETIKILEQTKENLKKQAEKLTQEVERITRAHQQAIDHANAQVVEGKRALLSDIRSLLEPKIGDAKLYLDRPNPVAPQALRLIGEMAEALKSKEVRQ